jgi:hypothetical protein
MLNSRFGFGMMYSVMKNVRVSLEHILEKEIECTGERGRRHCILPVFVDFIDVPWDAIYRLSLSLRTNGFGYFFPFYYVTAERFQFGLLDPVYIRPYSPEADIGRCDTCQRRYRDIMQQGNPGQLGQIAVIQHSSTSMHKVCKKIGKQIHASYR